LSKTTAGVIHELVVEPLHTVERDAQVAAGFCVSLGDSAGTPRRALESWWYWDRH